MESYICQKTFYFQTWHYFENFHCIDRVISIHPNLLQSKLIYVRMGNDKCLTSNCSLMFVVNVDLKACEICYPSLFFGVAWQHENPV